MSSGSTAQWTPAAVALGANLGDRERSLEAAVAALDATPGARVTAVSPWFETEPVGGPPGQPLYLNGACLLECELAPEALLAELQRIEAAAGRDRSREVTNGPRSLDLDLLLFGSRRMAGPELELPHPRLEQRLFVLAPLAAIAPELELPSGLTVAERLQALRGKAVACR